jgi:hypothetical protein
MNDSVVLEKIISNCNFLEKEKILSTKFKEVNITKNEIGHNVSIIYSIGEIRYPFELILKGDSIKLRKEDYLILSKLKEINTSNYELSQLKQGFRKNKQFRKVKIENSFDIITLSFFDKNIRQKIIGSLNFDLIKNPSIGDVMLLTDYEDFDHNTFFSLKYLNTINLNNFKLVLSLRTTSPPPNKLGIRWVYVFSTEDFKLRALFAKCRYFKESH